MVELEFDTESEGLAVITIDRPQARNAIAPETMDQLDVGTRPGRRRTGPGDPRRR